MDLIYCPVCDWAEDPVIRDMSVADMDCPGCGTRKMSDFISEGEWVQRQLSKDPADWWKSGKEPT